MKGNESVKTMLQRAVNSELAAINQYILHSEMQENWGYAELAKKTKARAIEEMGHASTLIHRLLYLDGKPTVSDLDKVSIGDDIMKQFQSDLSAEYDAVKLYNEAIKACVSAGDNGTRELFEGILKDEEAHVDYLEAQLFQIGEMGYQNYLAAQLEA